MVHLSCVLVILKTHLLGIYGAKKLGKSRAVNDGGAYIVDAGGKSYAEMIKKPLVLSMGLEKSK